MAIGSLNSIFAVANARYGRNPFSMCFKAPQTLKPYQFYDLSLLASGPGWYLRYTDDTYGSEQTSSLILLCTQGDCELLTIKAAATKAGRLIIADEIYNSNKAFNTSYSTNRDLKNGTTGYGKQLYMKLLDASTNAADTTDNYQQHYVGGYPGFRQTQYFTCPAYSIRGTVFMPISTPPATIRYLGEAYLNGGVNTSPRSYAYGMMRQIGSILLPQPGVVQEINTSMPVQILPKNFTLFPLWQQFEEGPVTVWLSISRGGV